MKTATYIFESNIITRFSNDKKIAKDKEVFAYHLLLLGYHHNMIPIQE